LYGLKIFNQYNKPPSPNLPPKVKGVKKAKKIETHYVEMLAAFF